MATGVNEANSRQSNMNDELPKHGAYSSSHKYRQVKKAELTAKKLHQPDQILSQAMQIPPPSTAPLGSAQLNKAISPSFAHPAIVHNTRRSNSLHTLSTPYITESLPVNRTPPLLTISISSITQDQTPPATLTLDFPLPSYNLCGAVISCFFSSALSSYHFPVCCYLYIHTYLSLPNTIPRNN